METKRWFGFVVLLSVLLNVNFLLAELVNINFYEPGQPPLAKTGAAATGEAGDQWNNITNDSTAQHDNLIDSAGNSTSISFIKNNGSNYYCSGATTDELLWAYASTNNDGSSSAFIISGLDSDTTYDLYLYSVWNWSSNTVAFTIDGTTLRPNQGDIYLTSFVENENYIVFSGITGTTSITCEYAYPEGGDRAPFNGLQIVGTVPEPATMSLLLLGTLGFVIRKRM